MRLCRVPLRILLSAALLRNTPVVAALLPGFDNTFLWRAKSSPTDFDFIPDGRVVMTLQNGQVWVLAGVAEESVADEPAKLNETLALDLTDVTCNFIERGMLSVAVHPEFSKNNFLYLLYTFKKYGTCGESVTEGPVNRLSRFVMQDNIIDRTSELVLFDTPSLPGNFRNSGCIKFGKDGNIYATVGDGGYDAPIQANGNTVAPQDANNLLGKVIRLTDGGDIPENNPFALSKPDTARCNEHGAVPPDAPSGTKCQEVYAVGLRNPFRFAMDPNTAEKHVRFFINDPGADKWEEINEGFPGANYGWPHYEGPCKFGTNETSCSPDPSYRDPTHWYRHRSSGGAITAGSFVPNGVWPALFDGSYLFVDWMFGEMFSLHYESSSGCRTCDPPRSDFIAKPFAGSADDRKEAVSMGFGPMGDSGQALYYVVRTAYGDALFDGLYRIHYDGTTETTRWWIAIVATVAVVVVLCAFVYAKRRRRQKREPTETAFSNLEMKEGQYRDEPVEEFRDEVAEDEEQDEEHGPSWSIT